MNLDFACFDIETSSLDADFSVMLAASIKPFSKKTLVFRIDEYNLQWKTGDRKDDSRIVAAIWKELSNHAVIVTHYGYGFDIPYMKAKAVKYNIAVPSPLYYIDTYSLAKANLKVSHRRLESLVSYFFGEGKTVVEGETWMKAAMDGDIAALDNIVQHNIKDVVLLERLAMELFPFTKSIKRV